MNAKSKTEHITCPQTKRVLQVKAANNAEDKADAAAGQILLDKVCSLYNSKQAKYTDSQRYEKLRYDMLIAAIDGALPMHSSAMVRRFLPYNLSSSDGSARVAMVHLT